MVRYDGSMVLLITSFLICLITLTANANEPTNTLAMATPSGDHSARSESRSITIKKTNHLRDSLLERIYIEDHLLYSPMPICDTGNLLDELSPRIPPGKSDIVLYRGIYKIVTNQIRRQWRKILRADVKRFMEFGSLENTERASRMYKEIHRPPGYRDEWPEYYKPYAENHPIKVKVIGDRHDLLKWNGLTIDNEGRIKFRTKRVRMTFDSPEISSDGPSSPWPFRVRVNSGFKYKPKLYSGRDLYKGLLRGGIRLVFVFVETATRNEFLKLEISVKATHNSYTAYLEVALLNF